MTDHIKTINIGGEDVPVPEHWGRYTSPALKQIADERLRQIEQEGYSPDMDDAYTNEQLAGAATAYAIPAIWRSLVSYDPHGTAAPAFWPWHETAFKPSPDNRKRELIKAAALLLAEIERLERLEK